MVLMIAFGLATALLVALANGALFLFSESQHSLLFLGIGGAVPIDWALVAVLPGLAAGFGYRSIDRAHPSLVMVLGAGIAVAANLMAHAAQFLPAAGIWDTDNFVEYLTWFGDSWDIGPWYVWVSAALSAVVGAFVTWGSVTRQRVNNVEAALPPWVPATTRILLHVAGANDDLSDEQVARIAQFLQHHLMAELALTPEELEGTIGEILEQEVEAARDQRIIDRDLVRTSAQVLGPRREATLALIRAVAEADGDMDPRTQAAVSRIELAWQTAIDAVAITPRTPPEKQLSPVA